MTAARTMAWGTLAATLVAAVAWAQQPGTKPETDVPSSSQVGGGGGFGGFFPVGMNQGLGSATSSNPFGGAREKSLVAQLAQQYVKSTKEDEKKDLRKKLSDALGKQFDQLAEQQHKELEDLEKQVASLKALLEKRHDARATIIDRKLDQVLQEAEGLGWGTHSGAPQAGYFTPQGRQ
jgi:hypothetical protein